MVAKSKQSLTDTPHPRPEGRLADYEGPIRQLVVADLGHEEPTVL